ncbi:MAG TPA: hypothetical protein PLD20_31110 [Blastocatellia bacterium]|nr:hypothetical protein [Blastocatellia bacterium]HMV83784.1 hypothetical protein [Blastocatellia bacterium]HMX27550.1 hypothetical protein [Blastocatellia bacterium]HMY71225.1 hypothetical protein [Blastocatellia bacterium]HMZ22421.1 hypothetical protein [Blastocatellia bacterium]
MSLNAARLRIVTPPQQFFPVDLFLKDPFAGNGSIDRNAHPKKQNCRIIVVKSVRVEASSQTPKPENYAASNLHDKSPINGLARDTEIPECRNK